jgi:hypothetical protein
MINRKRKLFVFLSVCSFLVLAAYLLAAPSPAPSNALLDPDDPDYRLSPPSSGEYYNVWDPSNNVHESHYNGVFQRGGPFDRNLLVGGGRFRGSHFEYRIGNLDLGSGAAARNAYATILAAINVAYVRAKAARLRGLHSEDASEISALSARQASLSSSMYSALASQSESIHRLAAHTHLALVNHAHAIRRVRRNVRQLNQNEALEAHRLYVLLHNQHALERLGATAYATAKSVRGMAKRAEDDAANAQSDASSLGSRILSLQQSHNQNVAYILQISRALLKTNALVSHTAILNVFTH